MNESEFSAGSSAEVIFADTYIIPIKTNFVKMLIRFCDDLATEAGIPLVLILLIVAPMV
jgi:hypothetical protein